MNIRTTIDPISLREVHNPDLHPYLLVGDGINGLEIYFETEMNRQIYLEMELEDIKILAGNDSDDYIPHG